MKILIVSKQNKICFSAAKKLEALLKKHRHSVSFDPLTARELKRHGSEIDKFRGDFVITLGGDGTFIYAAEKTSLPLLPVRVEGFGYLTSIDFDKIMKNPEELRKGKIVEKTRIQVIGKGIDAPLAINEVIFVRKIPSKIIKMNVEIDGVELKLRGDGIIFSTTSGSTAYALSAGGSVIDSDIKAFEIVPILPFNSKMKPLVIPENKKITLRADSGFLVVDGLWEKHLEKQPITIQKGKPIKIVSFGENFYKKFNEKFLA